MLFFSDVADFQDSTTSSNELPGSSLTSLGTLQKKEKWLLWAWNEGYLLLYEGAEPQSDLGEPDKYLLVKGRYNAYFSHHEVFFFEKALHHALSISILAQPSKCIIFEYN